MMKKTGKDRKIRLSILTAVIIAVASACTVRGQEIDLRGRGVCIVNQNVTPETTDNTDFGDVNMVGAAITHTFTIHNADLVNPLHLTDSSPCVSLLGDADFTLTKAPETSIPPGGQTTFEISFDPAVSGQRMAIVFISSNDADEHPYLFSIRGKGISMDDGYDSPDEANGADLILISGENESSERADTQTGMPRTFELSQNYPNPFNPTTSIGYGLPGRSHVNITVYDINGRLVQVLVDDTRDAGYHTVWWDASRIGTGVYFYRIRADRFTQVRKCMLIR